MIENARKLKAEVQALVDKRIAEKQPPNKTARVVSIDPLTRTAMVVYLGEIDPVRMSYLGVAPSAPDQEVIIGGPPNDRHIIDVKGSSGVEDDLNNYKAERRIAQVQLGISADFFSVGTSAGWKAMKYNIASISPVNLQCNLGATPTSPGVDGIITIIYDGMYRLSAKTSLTGTGTSAKVEHRIKLNNLSGFDDVGEVAWARIDGNASIVAPLFCETLLPLHRGDTLQAHLYNEIDLTFDKRSTVLIINREGPIPT